MAQFKVATLEVYHLDKFVAMLALKRGLYPSYLTYSLDKTPTKFYSDMLAYHRNIFTLTREPLHWARPMEGQVRRRLRKSLVEPHLMEPLAEKLHQQVEQLHPSPHFPIQDPDKDQGGAILMKAQPTEAFQLQ